MALLGGMALAAAQLGTVAAAINPNLIVTRTATTTVAAGGNGTATASCPAGDLVVTGGAYWHVVGSDISSPALNTFVRSSAPTKSLSGWYATGKNATILQMQMTTIARCLPKAALGAYKLMTRDVTVDPHRPGNADLQCKAGLKVLAGGGVWHKPGAKPKSSLEAFLTNDAPDSTAQGWSVVGWNDGSSILILAVSAVCVPEGVIAPGYSSSSGGGNTTYGDTWETYRTCPVSTAAVAGGFSWILNGDPDTGTKDQIESSAPTSDGSAWYAAARNSDFRRSDTEEAANATVFCVKLP